MTPKSCAGFWIGFRQAWPPRLPEKLYTDQGKIFTSYHLKSSAQFVCGYARPAYAAVEGKLELVPLPTNGFEARLIIDPPHSGEINAPSWRWMKAISSTDSQRPGGQTRGTLRPTRSMRTAIRDRLGGSFLSVLTPGALDATSAWRATCGEAPVHLPANSFRCA